MGHRGPRLLLSAALLSMCACGGGRARNPFDSSPGAQGILVLYLENRGFNDVRIQAITPAGPKSLGSVGGNTFQRATLDWPQPSQISFRIEVLAGRTYTTHAVAAQPGDRLELIIPDNPANAILRPRNGLRQDAADAYSP
jgi:hypothetical protein